MEAGILEVRCYGRTDTFVVVVDLDAGEGIDLQIIAGNIDSLVVADCKGYRVVEDGHMELPLAVRDMGLRWSIGPIGGGPFQKQRVLDTQVLCSDHDTRQE